MADSGSEPLMTGQLDAFVFDLDGTLWDATGSSANGWGRAAEEQGFSRKLTHEDIGRICGLPFDECVEVLFPDLTPEERAHLGPHLARAEEEAVRADGGCLYDGVVSGLQQLASLRPVLLLSNCHRWYLEVFLEQSGLEAVFAETLCHGDTGLPKSGNLALLRDRHGFGEAAYVGDTRGDQEACEVAGYEFVYAAYGFGTLDAKPAHRTFEDVRSALAARIA